MFAVTLVILLVEKYLEATASHDFNWSDFKHADGLRNGGVIATAGEWNKALVSVVRQTA
jgi:hypothetical protein